MSSKLAFTCLRYADYLLCSCYDEVRKVITFSLQFYSMDLDIKDDRHKVCISSRMRLMSDKLLLEQSR